MAAQGLLIVVTCQPAVVIAVNAVTSAMNLLVNLGVSTRAGVQWCVSAILANVLHAVISNEENSMTLDDMTRLKESWLEAINEAMDDVIADTHHGSTKTEREAASATDELFAKIATKTNKGN